MSGVTYGTLEARVVMAHLRMKRFDLAAASMARLVYPYSRLFKADSPPRAMGCGPGDCECSNRLAWAVTVAPLTVPTVRRQRG